jgi:putative endonuclease
MYFTYILYSPSAGKYYIGSTQDVEERLRRHNAGHSKSTKGKEPWELVKSFPSDTRSLAIKLEMEIKKRGAGRYLSDKGLLPN